MSGPFVHRYPARGADTRFEHGNSLCAWFPLSGSLGRLGFFERRMLEMSKYETEVERQKTDVTSGTIRVVLSGCNVSHCGRWRE